MAPLVDDAAHIGAQEDEDGADLLPFCRMMYFVTRSTSPTLERIASRKTRSNTGR
jgi:hypothetical protein